MPDCPGCEQPMAVLTTCPRCGLSRSALAEVQTARSRWAESQVNEGEVDTAVLQAAVQQADERRLLLTDIRERLRQIVVDIDDADPPVPPVAWIEARR